METGSHHWYLTIHFEILGFFFKNKVGLVGHCYRHYFKISVVYNKKNKALLILKSLNLSKLSYLMSWKCAKITATRLKEVSSITFTDSLGAPGGGKWCILGLVVILGVRNLHLLTVELSVLTVRLIPYPKHSSVTFR